MFELTLVVARMDLRDDPIGLCVQGGIPHQSIRKAGPLHALERRIDARSAFGVADSGVVPAKD